MTYFDANFHNGGYGFRMNLANGYIDVPDKTGCYILSTGCGTGKTECCKSIISQRFNDGILYCVDTIAELDKMYRWISENSQSLGIRQDDVIIISSDPRHQQFLHIYKDNPAILMQKKIVLITHVRFWTDLINYFLIYKPQSPVKEFDGDFGSRMARGDLRKFVLFDETPRFIKPFFSMPYSILASFVDEKGDCFPVERIRWVYNKFISTGKYNPFPSGKTRLDDIKRNVIFDMIPKLFPQWIDSNMRDCDIAFTPLNLSQTIVNTHILVLEGAGNILFQDSQYYELLDIERKYNSPVHFEQFKFDVRRRSMQFDTTAFDNFITWVVDRVNNNQMQHKKTLITVWKNYGKDNNDSSDTGYYDFVVSRLYNSRLDRNYYNVIYYGGPESKSTNDFRDFDEIILAGTWNIPNTETFKFNGQYGLSISNEQHRAWAFIQLLCRIGIRMHNGRDYSVCYSSDFNDDFMKKLDDYMKNKMTLINQVPSESKIPEWLEDKFIKLKIRANFYDEIMALCKWRADFLEVMKRGERLSCTITLSEIRNIVFRSRGKRSEYGSLLAKMKKLGISLQIK